GAVLCADGHGGLRRGGPGGRVDGRAGEAAAAVRGGHSRAGPPGGLLAPGREAGERDRGPVDRRGGRRCCGGCGTVPWRRGPGTAGGAGAGGSAPGVAGVAGRRAGGTGGLGGGAGAEPEVVLTADPEPMDGEAKGARDLMLPAWSKGRYGSAVGRAVHGVLQVLDLASGAGLEDGVAAQCVAEGVPGQEEVVAGLVRSALGSEVVQRAAVREHWREVYVGTVATDGALRTEDGAELAGAGQVLEGYVDLVYREDDGSLVVVDYKTDAVRAAALGARAGYYRAQVEAYRRCLGDATGAKVAGVLLFLHPEAAAVPAPVG